MARVRLSRAEAHGEATRRASAFIAERDDRDNWRHISTTPDTLGPSRRAAKSPVVWVAMYAPIPPSDVVIDGGELFVVVDLESGTVGLRQC